MATAPSANDLTRQQLDELDALLQRMLSLPLNGSDAAGPPPIPVDLPIPINSEKAAAPSPSVMNWRVDLPAQPPTPAPHLLAPPLPVDVSTPRVRTPEPVSIPVVAAPIDVSPPPRPTPPQPVVAPAPRVPAVEPPPRPVLVKPEPPPAAFKLPPVAEPEPAVPVTEPKPPTPAPERVVAGSGSRVTGPQRTEPVVPPSPAANPPAVPAPVPPPEPVPVFLWPFVALNWLADTLLGMFGPPGQLLRSGFGKNLLGFVGVGLLAYTAAHVATGRGWLSLPFPLPWPR